MQKVIKGFLIFLVLAVVNLSFTSNYNILLSDFEAEAHEGETHINRYLELSRTFIELMTIYGNEYFQQSKNINSELYSLLDYDPYKDSFTLDAAAGTKYQRTSGNLTGRGRIPEKGIRRDELNLALRYNEFFNNFYDRLEGVEWLYYISENDFINLYPWMPSSEFELYDNMESNEVFRLASPKNNPQRRALWSPVNLDHTQKSLVVTLSSPIYYQGTFMGVIALDISADKLRELISTEYESYLIDVKNSIIATDSQIKPGRIPVNFITVLKDNQMNSTGVSIGKEGMVHRIGGYYVHSVNFDKVPWSLYFMVPVVLIALKAAIATLPVLIIGILLIFAIYEFEKVKRTEQLLENSLEELKSYQERLENAAKFDMLTNTYNRRGLKESFKARVDKGSTIKVPISFIISDIDYFKQFNDSFGHAAGDKVLKEIANTIRGNIGSDDILCRWGGEEFVMVLFDRTYEKAMDVAEKIRKDVENLSVLLENGTLLKGTMTFGVAEYNYTDSIEDCISKADNALYLGKEKGRNVVKGYMDC